MKWEETVNETNYLGVSLNSSVEWDKKEKEDQQKGNQDVIANDMFNQGDNARKDYEIVMEAGVLYGVKVWGKHESWNLTGAIPTKFYKKILGIE
jgi:hypothetical protein